MAWHHRWLIVPALLAACASGPPAAAPRFVLYGESHDQPDHQRQVAADVQALAGRGALAALVIEMAEQGRDTRSLPRDASDAQVRDALAWAGWDWSAYAGVVMAAVRSGVPVLGGNLPRAQMRAAMADASLDAQVDDSARERIADAVRTGHCNLLPREREPGMVRVQIARDRSLASTLSSAAAQRSTGQQVLLLSGAQHTARDRGVPRHLQDAAVAAADIRTVLFGDESRDLPADEHRPAAFTPRPDPCDKLRPRG